MKELAVIEVKKVDVPRIDWNFEEIKSNALEIAEEFKNLVVTLGTLGDCKKVKTTFSKAKKELSDKRIEVKKLFTKNVTDFENQVKEIDSILSEVETKIDAGVKFYEEQEKEAKRQEIETLRASMIADLPEKYHQFVTVRQEFLNKTATMKSIKDSFQSDIINVKNMIDAEKQNVKAIVQHCRLMMETFNISAFFVDKYIKMLEYKELSEILVEITEFAKSVSETAKKKVEQEKVLEVEKPIEPVKVQAPVVELKENLPVKDKTLKFLQINKIQYQSILDFLDENNITYEVIEGVKNGKDLQK